MSTTGSTEQSRSLLYFKFFLQYLHETGSGTFSGPFSFFMKIIFDYNRTIYDPEKQELYPGVLVLINGLSNKHELFLVSKNEPGRRDVLDNLGISSFFKKVIFTDNKSPELFKEIADNENNVMVVGDRIRGEISIGNELSYITVWLKRGKFSLEEPINEKQNPRHTITDITEVENILKQYG
ncbi:hypothetical protein A2823_02375 [Candidatus Nomurabacteria bacterium RIFCSPHIGHO2_01_FULL_41_91]|uniref:Uncharacterized protein n=1 Tax=Candidatus Nomurabacteria bacterium RIFCSPLOWO2_12_FULL_41_10 TaxID=1801795 RepID=A0A1F6YAP9_9BACT|nr:MAG: hypothetical protein A2823_02375 [Candidatus Nomurabacteria bacterium RIFCSPHIGHO2_01_FULL_41_91]OGI80751.1 MAG: hypothetical protein A3D43_00540 [Candidatus Nomurabacteria bacterium RIFCSPHIGHO2_02_FULL_41_52]OGI84738.1 MAG: hypothetical protein A3F49_02705 [Candidatus Nomurabacteria bacterium RIFCSPHIGHO2_12_FULL_42_19]OGI93547.1 MAG: hypothetical protein A3A07_00935 [Candidatus Nomurabacteria bacterium RIFCSPLOWO2_01_FULL_41_52]OGI99711.1 MAG: hypothetical protein A3H56_01125 [Candid